MKLDLHEIAHSPGILYTYEVEGEDSEALSSDLASSGVVLHEPVRGRVTFTNTGNLILARGDLNTSIDLECIRCLSHFPSEQTIRLEEQFPVKSDQNLSDDWRDHDEIDIADDTEFDLADGVFDDGMLDLTELVRQNLIVTVPLHAVCREYCKGLCLHCGKNLNDGICSCQPDVDEPAHPFREAFKDWDKD